MIRSDEDITVISCLAPPLVSNHYPVVLYPPSLVRKAGPISSLNYLQLFRLFHVISVPIICHSEQCRRTDGCLLKV